MEIRRIGSQPSGKGPEDTSAARCASILCFKPVTPGAWSVSASRSSLALGPRGTASVGPDLDRDRWMRAGAAVGRTIETIRPGDVIRTLLGRSTGMACPLQRP